MISGNRTKFLSPEPAQLALLPAEPSPLRPRQQAVLDAHDEQLEALPEWDGTIPVPYGVIPF